MNIKRRWQKTLYKIGMLIAIIFYRSYIMDGIFSRQRIYRIIENVLNVCEKRHYLLTSNISNIDTPNYRSKDIDFKKTFKNILKNQTTNNLSTTSTKHINFSDSPSIVVKESGTWNGINYVDINNEMIKLTENNLLYRSTIEIFLRKLSLLKEVLREGGR